MRTKLRVFGLPLHPLLVHFPIAFWLTLPVFDLLVLRYGVDPWWTIAFYASAGGVLVGAAAIAAGFLEYIQPTLVGIDMRLAARHGIRTSLAWCVFLVRTIVAWGSPGDGVAVYICLALDLLGCVLLLQGIYFGTRQVYEQLDNE